MQAPRYRYRDNPDAVRALVRPREVHRDVYIDEEVFQLEMEHLFANTWVYAGHASQAPEPGDFITCEIGGQPLLISRHTDGEIYVNYNRCAHKGTRIAGEPCGKAGEMFTCPYHGWAFRTDGSLLSVPLRKGYDGTGFEDMPPDPRPDAGEERRGLPRLHLRQAERRRAGLRELLRREPLDHRQHGGPLARGPAGRRGRAAPLHAPLQLEDAGREPDRHLPSDGRPREQRGHGGGGVGGGRPQRPAPARRAAGAVLPELRVLRRHGHPGLAERARPYRGHRLDSCRLFGNPGLLGEDGGRLRGGAGRGDPRRDPP